MKIQGYQPHQYRTFCQNSSLVNFNVTVNESDLLVKAIKDLTAETAEILTKLRREIESYILIDKNFMISLAPIDVLDYAPTIVKKMAKASSIMDVGPMAAVAGAIAEDVARGIANYSDTVVVENGGDIFIINQERLTVGIYAGDSLLSMKLGIELDAHPEGISICTSSGTVGHSLSFGNADAVTVLAHNGSFADVSATALCNMVKDEVDVEQVLNYARNFKEIMGLIIIINNKIGIIGEKINLVPI